MSKHHKSEDPCPSHDLLKKARKRGLLAHGSEAAVRHIVVCGDSDCGGGDGRETYKRLSQACKRLEDEHGVTVLRTRAECMGLCKQGPIAVVYPEGTWYHSLEGRVVDTVVEQHLHLGIEVSSHVLARNALRMAEEAAD
jgi:(2Fe-2S) ferredoxin